MLENGHYDHDAEGRRLLTCRKCLDYVNERNHRQQQIPDESLSTLPPPSAHTFTPVSSKEEDYQSNCVSEEAIAHIKNFYAELEKERMETCLGCNERWFGMEVRNDRCRRCAKGQYEQRFGASNGTDPGPSLAQLCQAHDYPIPEPPSQIEEMLLATYHILLQTWQVNGGQTKYTGHTCLFAHDTGQFITKLPMAPADLDVLVIRPASASVTTISRQPEFQVRRARILDNLRALQRFHPDYAAIEVNDEVLASLPEDGSVFEQLRSTSVEDGPDHAELGVNTMDDSAEEELITEAMIPNVGEPIRVVDDVRAALAPLVQQNLILTAPVIQASLVNEHDPSNPFLRRAFPFLFPSGQGDLHSLHLHKVAEADYFAHLIRYKDGRFAQDPRFRYYAFNCIMRWRAKRAAGFYVSRHDDDRELVASDFADLLEGDARELAARIRRHGSMLLGTGPYWGRQSKNLQAMIRQLGTPHAFITHSAADIQWPDLHLHMPTLTPPSLSEAEQQRHNARNINKNPAIAAWWFQRRWSLFFRLVIKPLFDVQEHWFRYEWQHRGSSHVHGLIWLNGAPSPDNLDISNSETVNAFLDYWGARVCAVNPKAQEQPAPVHPCAISPADLTFTHRDLAQILNRVQHHTRCTTYCLRRKKGSPPNAPLQCRFAFPKEDCDTPHLTIGSTGNKVLVVERNNPLLNHYNPVLILGWRANLDISPCTEPHAVATYIAKYASKAEKPSLAFGEVMMTIARRVEEDTSARIVFQKMLSRILTERDYSAQEVCHQLLLCKMVSASREFVSLCLLENRQRRIRGQEDGEQDTEALEESDMRDAYEQRHEQYINLSLYEWYKDYRRVGRRISKRKHSAIVTLWPPYHPGPEGSDAADNWSRAKLLLHHPHRATADLKNPAETWEAAYQRCLLDHPEGHKDTLPLRPAREHGTRQDTQDEEWSDPEEEEEEQEREDWQVYAGIAPGLAGHDMDGPAFGFRLIDAEEDWHALGGRIGGEELSVRGAFIDAAKRSDQQTITRVPVNIASLNPIQSQVHSKVCRHAQAVLHGRIVKPFLLNIDGTAGTGKSFLIDAISQSLNEMAPPHAANPLVRRLAPTGVAAFNIGGETYHSALRLKIGADAEEHGIGDGLGALQEAWTGTQYLIIDEKSMVGRRAFGLMDRMFRQIFPQASHLPFGGLSVLLFGDFGQLPPVGDTPLFVTTLDRGTTYPKMLSNQGRQAYLAFNESIELTAIMRQSDCDDTTLAFKTTLGRLREGTPTEDDYRLLSSRFWTALPITDRQRFENALCLAATKQMVHEINVDNLHRAQKPVLRCVARSTGPGATRASEDEAGAAQIIYLMVGAKVMLTRNIWTAKGLTNGAMGVVDSIILAPGDSPQHTTPAVVMVEFAAYSGPSQWHNTYGKPLVPITPYTTTWEGTGGARCSRRQLPLRLAYAVTIHKSQGVTLDRVIINIGEKEFNRGLTFVAVSRSKRLDGIAFRPGFAWERLQCLQPKQRSASSDNASKAKADEARRRRLGFTIEPVFLDNLASTEPHLSTS